MQEKNKTPLFGYLNDGLGPLRRQVRNLKPSGKPFLDAVRDVSEVIVERTAKERYIRDIFALLPESVRPNFFREGQVVHFPMSKTDKRLVDWKVEHAEKGYCLLSRPAGDHSHAWAVFSDYEIGERNDDIPDFFKRAER